MRLVARPILFLLLSSGNINVSVHPTAKVICMIFLIIGVLILPGITALLALGILESIQEQGKAKPLLEMEHNSVEYLHTLVEAMRLVSSHDISLVMYPYPAHDIQISFCR